MEWKNIYRGLLMGASDVVPGVSGGTIAVVLGIYDRLIGAINGLATKEWKKQFGFLIPLGIGVITAILLLADLIEWLFEFYPGPTQFGFLGLIIGVLPYLFHKADARKTYKPRHIGILVIGAVLVAMMGFFQSSESAPVDTFTVTTYLWLFVCSFFASSAMILPGISGSFLLLILGAYSTIIAAVSNLQLDVIAVVGMGVLLGILVMSKIIYFFLKNYTTATFAAVTGLVVGSVFVIFPGWPSADLLIASVAAFMCGLLAAFLLGRVEYS